jgi:hypothetical protein
LELNSAPNGSSLVFGSFGGAVQLWDAAIGQGIGAPPIVESGAGVQANLAVAFSQVASFSTGQPI